MNRQVVQEAMRRQDQVLPGQAVFQRSDEILVELAKAALCCRRKRGLEPLRIRWPKAEFRQLELEHTQVVPDALRRGQRDYFDGACRKHRGHYLVAKLKVLDQ